MDVSRMQQLILHSKLYDKPVLNEEIPVNKILEIDQTSVKVSGHDI